MRHGAYKRKYGMQKAFFVQEKSGYKKNETQRSSRSQNAF